VFFFYHLKFYVIKYGHYSVVFIVFNPIKKGRFLYNWLLGMLYNHLLHVNLISDVERNVRYDGFCNYYVLVVTPRYCFLYAHCWLIQILMTHLFRKLLICTKLTGPSMRPLLAAGPRSMPWADLCLDIVYWRMAGIYQYFCGFAFLFLFSGVRLCFCYEG